MQEQLLKIHMSWCADRGMAIYCQVNPPILLIMSLLTWFIMITKFFDQRRQRLQAIEARRVLEFSTS